MSSDGGKTFSSNIQLNSASSDATSTSLDQNGQQLQYGDYATLAFIDGVLYPAWAGNAVQPTGNPDLPNNANIDIITNQVTVAHVAASPFTLAPVTTSASQNIPFTGAVAVITDSNSNPSLADYSVTINWGDGTVTAGSVERQGSVLNATGTHQYAVAGAENVTVTVSKRDGATETVQSLITVAAAPLIGSFGSDLGRLSSTLFLPPTSDGTQVTFVLANGRAQAYREQNTGNYDLLLTGKNMQLTVRVSGGAKHITFGTVIVNGSVNRIVAPSANVGGTFYVNSSIGTATFGDVTGDIISAGAINSLTVHSLRNSRVLTAVNLGSDASLGGGGTTLDSYSAGVIGTLKVQTAIVNSTIAAGASPGDDGFIGTPDDIGLGGGIFNIIAGSIDSSSRFESNFFSKARLPGKVTPAKDVHFVTI